MQPSRRLIERTLQWAAKRFPQSKVSADTITAYAEELGNIDPARLELAFKAIIAKGEFWPSIARILDAERNLVFGDDDAKRFRTLELALIALNEERKAGLIQGDAYHIAYHKILDASGFTYEQLEKGQVSPPDKSGHSADKGLTWDQLEWRRRSYSTQEPRKLETGTQRPKAPSQSVENIRAALSHSLNPDAKLPKDIQRWLDDEKRGL